MALCLESRPRSHRGSFVRHRWAGRLGLLVLVILPLVQAGCELLGDTTVPDWARIDEVSYRRHVQFMLDDGCIRCHGTGKTESALDLSSWDGLMAGSDFGEAVIPFDAGRSRLYRMVARGTGGGHPADVGGDTLSTAQLEVLRRWIDDGAADDTGRIFGTDGGPRVYVAGTGDASVWVIDPTRMVVVRVIDLVDLQFGTSSRPGFVTAARDGTALYVSVEGENVVLRFNRDGDLVGLADVASPGPLSLSDDGKTLAVGRATGDYSDIVIIETDDMRATTAGVLFSRPHAVAVKPQGDYVLAVSQAADQAVMLPLTGSNDVVLGLTGRRHVAEQAVFTPSGNRAFVTGSASGQVVVLDVESGGTMRQTAAIDVALDPVQPAISADGKLLAVVSATGAVTMIDADLLGVVRTVSHGSMAEPEGVAFAGGRLFVSGRNRSATYTSRRTFGGAAIGTVTVIEPVTGGVLRVLEVGVEPTAMASSHSD